MYFMSSTDTAFETKQLEWFHAELAFGNRASFDNMAEVYNLKHAAAAAIELRDFASVAPNRKRSRSGGSAGEHIMVLNNWKPGVASKGVEAGCRVGDKHGVGAGNRLGAGR